MTWPWPRSYLELTGSLSLPADSELTAQVRKWEIRSKFGLPKSGVCENICVGVVRRKTYISHFRKTFCRTSDDNSSGSHMVCRKDQQIGGKSNGGKGGEEQVTAPKMILYWWLDWRDICFGQVQLPGQAWVLRGTAICWLPSRRWGRATYA